MALSEEVIDEYKTSLTDLHVNSKPLINMLTMLAEDHEQHAPEIVKVIEDHINKCKPNKKLPVLYLMDSIMKNLGQTNYKSLFAKNIVQTFTSVFEQVDEKTRASMFKLRQTWSTIVPNAKLYMIDVKINSRMDPAWPVTATAPETTSIHVNPKFLAKSGSSGSGSERSSPEAMPEGEDEEEGTDDENDTGDQEAKMRQQLIAKQQELIELQQARIKLELAETKEKLKNQRKNMKSGRTKASSLPLPPVIDDPDPDPVVEMPQQIKDPSKRSIDPFIRDPRSQSGTNIPEGSVPSISMPFVTATAGQHSAPSQINGMPFQQGVPPFMQRGYGGVFSGVVFPDDPKFSDSNDSDSSRSSVQDIRGGNASLQPKMNVKDPRLRKQLEEKAKVAQNEKPEPNKEISRDPRRKSPKGASGNQQNVNKDNRDGSRGSKDTQHNHSSREREGVQSSSRSPRKSSSDTHHSSTVRSTSKDRDSKSVVNLRDTFETEKRKLDDERKKHDEKDIKFRKKESVSRQTERSSRSREKSPEKSPKQLSSKTSLHKGSGDNSSAVKGARKSNEDNKSRDRKGDQITKNLTDRQSVKKPANVDSNSSDTKVKIKTEPGEHMQVTGSKSIKREKPSEERETSGERAAKKLKLAIEEPKLDDSLVKMEVDVQPNIEPQVSSDLSELFGSEDIDYRPVDQKGLPLQSPSSKGWDKFKASQPDQFAYDIELKKQRRDLDQRRTRQLSEASENQDTDLRILGQDSTAMTREDIPKELSLTQHSEIIIQAQKQLRHGHISAKQHQDLMLQVQELMQVQQKLQEETSKGTTESHQEEYNKLISPNSSILNDTPSSEPSPRHVSPIQESHGVQGYPEGHMPERDSRSPERPLERFKIPKKAQDSASPSKPKRGLHELYPERIGQEAWESGPPVLPREFNDPRFLDDQTIDHQDMIVPPDLKESRRSPQDRRRPEDFRERQGHNFGRERHDVPREPDDRTLRRRKNLEDTVFDGPPNWRPDEDREGPLPFNRRDKMGSPLTDMPEVHRSPTERRENWSIQEEERRDFRQDERYPLDRHSDNREFPENEPNWRKGGTRRNVDDRSRPRDDWYGPREDRGRFGPEDEVPPFERGPRGRGKRRGKERYDPHNDKSDGPDFDRRDMSRRQDFDRYGPGQFFDRQGPNGPPPFDRPEHERTSQLDRPLLEAPDMGPNRPDIPGPFGRPGPPRPEFDQPELFEPDYERSRPHDRDFKRRGQPSKEIDRHLPEFDKQGPLRPDFDRKGPLPPDFDRHGPRSPDFDRHGARSPDFNRHGPRSPDFNRHGPPRSDFDRHGPPRPDFDRPVPLIPEFDRHGPSRSEFDREGPPAPECDRHDPSRSEFDRPGPPRPEFDRHDPPRSEFDRPGPPRPEFDRHDPPRSEFDRPGPPRPDFDGLGPARSEIDRSGPPGAEFDRHGPPRPDFDRPGPHGAEFDMHGGPPRSDFDGHGPPRLDFDRFGPPGPESDRPGSIKEENDRRGPQGPEFDRHGPSGKDFDRHGDVWPDSDKQGPNNDRYDRPPRRGRRDRSGPRRPDVEENLERSSRHEQDRTHGPRPDTRVNPPDEKLSRRESSKRDESRRNRNEDKVSEKRKRRISPKAEGEKQQSKSKRAEKGSKSKDGDSHVDASHHGKSQSDSKKESDKEVIKIKEEEKVKETDINDNAGKELSKESTQEEDSSEDMSKPHFDPNKGLPPWQPVKRGAPVKDKPDKNRPDEKSERQKSPSRKSPPRRKSPTRKKSPSRRKSPTHRRSPPLSKSSGKPDMEDRRRKPDGIPSLLDPIEHKLMMLSKGSEGPPRNRGPVLPPPGKQFNPLPSDIVRPFKDGSRDGPRDGPPTGPPVDLLQRSVPGPPQQLVESYVDKYGDPRFRSFADLGPEVSEEVVFGKRNYEIKLGAPPRKIQFGNGFIEVYADPSKRGIVIDNDLLYRFGERVKEVTIRGKRQKMFYHGKPLDIWIDGNYYEVRVDSPPKTLIINNQGHRIQVDGRDMMILIDKAEKGPYGGEPRFIFIDDNRMELRFDPPPRHILIDGDMCELKLNVRQPCINVKGVLRGIRFQGPPREIFINGSRYQIFTDHAVKLRVGNRYHYVALGGPCHELIIDGKWYEVKFDQPPKEINVGNRVLMIHIPGGPPEVKILDPIVQEPHNMPMFNSVPRPMQMPGLGPPMGPGPPSMMPRMPPMMMGQPVSGPNSMGNQAMPPGFRPPISAPAPVIPGLGNLLSGIQSSQQNRMPLPGMGQPHVMPSVLSSLFPTGPPGQAPTPTPAGGMDINSLLDRLVSTGIIKKEAEVKPPTPTPETEAETKSKPDDTKASEAESGTSKKPLLQTETFEEVPEKTTFDISDLKVLHIGSVQRLYAGAQCNSCGTRFILDNETKAEKYREHLDWHFRQNKLKKDDTKVTCCRKWYYGVGDWIQYEEVTDLEDQTKSVFFEQQNNVQPTNQPQTPKVALITVPEGTLVTKCPAATGSDQDDLCDICHEPFEQYWDEELEEWHLRDAIRVNGKTYHPICYEDYTDVSEGTPSPSVLQDIQPDFSSRKSLTYEESSQDGLPHSSFEEERNVPKKAEPVLSLETHLDSVKTEPCDDTPQNVIKQERTDDSVESNSVPVVTSAPSITEVSTIKLEPDPLGFIKQEPPDQVAESESVFTKSYSKSAIPGLDVSFEIEAEPMDTNEKGVESEPRSTTNITEIQETMETDTSDTLAAGEITEKTSDLPTVSESDHDIESLQISHSEIQSTLAEPTVVNVTDVSDSTEDSDSARAQSSHLHESDSHHEPQINEHDKPHISPVEESDPQPTSHLGHIESISDTDSNILTAPVLQSTLSPLNRVKVSQPAEVIEISQEVLEISSNASTPTHDELPSPPSPGS